VDFDNSEWTPQDSAYGAACPVCGCLPKNVRRAIEVTLITASIFGLIYFVVTTSIRITNEHGSSGAGGNDNDAGFALDDDYYIANNHQKNNVNDNDDDDYYSTSINATNYTTAVNDDDAPKQGGYNHDDAYYAATDDNGNKNRRWLRHYARDEEFWGQEDVWNVLLLQEELESHGL